MNKQQTEMKEYLSQAFRIDQRIQSKMEQVASLNDLATRATATYSDMPGSETRNLHRMEDAILSIIELEAEINGDICKLVQTKKDIVHKIKAVQNTEYQTLLELRYLCFKSWAQIAVDMGYELRWLYRLHHRALVLLSSKIGPVLANNFPPQLLKNLFSVSEAPALIIKVQYLALMRQPVQQSCCEDSVAKKLRPAIKAFI